MLNVKNFKQKTEITCGPTCLKVILYFFGIKKSRDELVELCKSDAHGTRASNIVKAAKTLGLTGFVKDFCEFKDIRKYVVNKKIPVIVAWFSDYDTHYSVVVGIDKKIIYLSDPEEKHIRKFKLDFFRRIWFDFKEVLEKKEDIIIRRMIVLHKIKK
ncbi:C39 family peptidase [archaeon]|nr:C39 family peptidase [archaeon]